MKRSGYPHGRPGYVADHIVPLAKGGKDIPSNMQWQTIAEAKAKDRARWSRPSGSRRKFRAGSLMYSAYPPSQSLPTLPREC